MLYHMYKVNGDGGEIFEGIFTNKNEMADYLETNIATVNDIIEGNIEDLRKKFHCYLIYAEFTSNEQEDLLSSTDEEIPVLLN